MRNRKPIAILAVVMAWLLLASTALAVTLDIDVDKKEVYANGNDIVIKEGSGDRTVITDDDGAAVSYNRIDSGSNPASNHDVSGYTVYGGWKDGNRTDNNGTSVTMEGGEVKDIYGGNKKGDLDADTNIEIEGGTVTGNVYGGNKEDNLTGDTNVEVSGGTVNGNVYGGSRDDDGNRDDDVIGNTNVEVSDGTVKGSVYGGSRDDDVLGDTNVEVSGGTVNGNVYGGGEGENSDYADVKGNTNVVISGGEVKGSAYGGGKYSDIEDRDNSGRTEGNTNVTVSGGKVDKVFAGSEKKGSVENAAKIELTGGNISGKEVYAHGGSSEAGVNGNVLIKLYSLSATQYTFFLRSYVSNGSDIIKLEGPDFAGYSIVKMSSRDSWSDVSNMKAWVLQASAPKSIPIVTYFQLENSDGSKTTVHTIATRTATIPAGAPTTVTADTWDGGGMYDVGSAPSQQISWNYSNSKIYFYVPVTAKQKTIDVQFNYTFGGETVSTQTVENVAVTYGGGDVSVNYFRAGDSLYQEASGTRSVNFSSSDPAVFEIPLEGRIRPLTVRFLYLYNGTVITSDEKPVTLTYGEGDKTVTSTIAVPAGYYLLGDVPTVTVTYAMALEMGGEGVYEVDVLLGTAGGSNTPRIPLGPGATQTAIPLGIGVPSTGDGVSMNLLLIALGAAVVAFVAVRSKRYSAK